MPIYEYRCNGCGKTFDKLLAMAERNENQVCPDCGGQGVRKIISSFNSAGQSQGSTHEGCSGG